MVNETQQQGASGGDLKIVKLVSFFAIRFLDTREVLFQNIAIERSGFVYFKVSAESYELGKNLHFKAGQEGACVRWFYEQCRAGGVTINMA